MKICRITLALLILVVAFSIPGICSGLKGDLKRVGQWKYNSDEVPRILPLGYVDKDGDILGALFSPDRGYLIITPKKLVTFAKRGEGPADIMGMHSCTEYKGDIAVLELAQAGKMKIFTKRDGKYIWKKTKWFKTSMSSQMTRMGVFLKGKWFFAGMGFFYTGDKFYLKPVIHSFAVRVYDDDGNILKELVQRDFEGQTHYTNMIYYITTYGGNVLYASENELNVKVICPEELKVIKDVKLEIPPFYKAMPPEFYAHKNYQGDFSQFRKNIEHWRVSYSRITEMLIDGNYLVLQVRTCSDKLKRFAVLFYNADTFKLEKTVFIDDVLLASQNGKYYFFADGDPYLDDGVEECTINIYSFK